MATYPTKQSLVDSARRFRKYSLVRQGVSSIAAESSLAKGGDLDLTIRMVAELIVPAYALAEAKEDATFEDSSLGEDLDRLCARYGLSRSAGEVATGTVTCTNTSAVTYTVGAQLVSKSNGRRYAVASSYSGPTSIGGSIPLVSLERGPSMNLDAGQVLTWVSPILNGGSTVVVNSDGLVGGEAADTDSSLRKKLLKLLQEPQNGGSWAHVRQWVEDSNANVENAFVYPALRGPSTTHAAYTIEGTADNLYLRGGSATLTALINAYVLEQYPEHSDFTLTTVAHEELDLAMRLTLPEPVWSGGLGGGWIDPASGTVSRWPPRTATDNAVAVTTVNSETNFEVTATTAPVVGASVAFWDATNKKFVRGKVLSSTGVSGAYDVEFDTAMPTITAGCYLMPDAEGLDEYSRILHEQIAKLGPGEMTSDATVLARAYRHPRGGESSPAAIDYSQIAAIQAERPEVSALRYMRIDGTALASITFPYEPTATTPTSQPNVFWLRHVGFYP